MLSDQFLNTAKTNIFHLSDINGEKLIGIICLILFLTVFYIVYKSLRTLYVIKDLPTSKINTAAQGLVELQGRCYPLNDKYIKTISNSDAVLYNVEYQVYRTDNHGSSWHTIKSFNYKNDFLIGDGSGYSLVRTGDSEFKLKSYEIEYSSVAEEKFNEIYNLVNVETSAAKKVLDLTMRYQNFLSITFSRRFLIEEIIVHDPVYLFGNLRSHATQKVNTSLTSGQITTINYSSTLIPHFEYKQFISNMTQEDLLKSYNYTFFIIMAVSGLVFLFFTIKLLFLKGA